MRVLHVISSIDAHHGGPTVALIGLTKAQKRVGLDVRVASTYRFPTGPANVPSFAANHVPVEMIGPAYTGRMWHPKLTPTLRRLIADADVVHIHALFEEIQHQAAVVSRQLGKPYIVRPCGMLDPWSLRQGGWKKKIYIALRLRRDLDRAAAIHFTANAERDGVAPLGFKAPAIVEPNGLDLDEFADPPPHGAFRAKHPRIGDRPMVLFLSRIHPKKGLDLLIPAFAQAAPADAMLVLAGPAEAGYDAVVRELIQRHSLTDRVIWTGMLKGRDKLTAYVDADLFVLPSYQENFGNVVIESLACGTPVLVSDQVALWSDVTEGQVGGVCGTSVPSVAEGIQRWLGDADGFSTAAAGRARQFAVERFDWSAIAHRWSGHYNSLITSHSLGAKA